MATVHPFCAYRPRARCVREVVGTVPQERVSVEEAREIVARHPRSFLRVIKPEVDLQNGSRANHYAQGAKNLQTLLSGECFTQEAGAALYVYRIVREDHSHSGVFGCVAVGEYDNGTIIRHEKTRPIKVQDRVDHLMAQRAHTEPVLLTYREDQAIEQMISEAQSASDPLYDFKDKDGIRHQLWKLEQTIDMIEAFGQIPRLYVADGHHRCKAASRAAATLREKESVSSEVEFFPAVLFPMNQMQIKPYNRVVYRLPIGPEEFLSQLESNSTLIRDTGQPEPGQKGHVCIYLSGAWHRFELPPATRSDITADLDVAKLSDHILKPILGIKDARVNDNIGFVSGNKGTNALEEMVDDERADVAFSLYPTTIEELVEIADTGELMPPKSTWFEPKLKSGLLVHSFAKEQNGVLSSSDSVERRT